MSRTETLVIKYEEGADLTELVEAMQGKRKLLGGTLVCWAAGHIPSEKEKLEEKIEALREKHCDWDYVED